MIPKSEMKLKFLIILFTIIIGIKRGGNQKILIARGLERKNRSDFYLSF